MMKIYRLKYLPTGLYFCPSREVKVKISDGDQRQQAGVYVKSNLSGRGKTYLRKPSLTYIGGRYYSHLITSAKQLNSWGSFLIAFVDSEWVIEEME